MGGHVGSKGGFQEEEDNKLIVTGCVWEINTLCFCSVSFQHLKQNKVSKPSRVPQLALLTSLTKAFQPTLEVRSQCAACQYIIARVSTWVFTST